MSLSDILKDKHFNQFAAILSVAQTAKWCSRHPEVQSVRSRLDTMARFVKADGAYAFNNSESLRLQFFGEFLEVLMEVVMADPKLSYDTSDAQWLTETMIEADNPSLIYSLMFAVSMAQQQWYTAEQVAAFTGDASGTWKNRAAKDEVYARKAGKTWIFPSLALRGYGIAIPDQMQTEPEPPEEE